MRTLVWFRGKDLRVHDHAPLTDALRGEVIPLFVLDPYFFERADELPNRMQFLLESLSELESNIARLGSKLVIVRGKSTTVVPELATKWRVDRVAAHRWSEPFGRERDRRIAARVPLVLYEGETLVAPDDVRTKDGNPYSVFTPFAKAHAKVCDPGKPLAAPKRLPPLPIRARSERIPSLEALGLVRNPHVLVGGESAARKRLDAFVRGPMKRYAKDRDRLDRDGTSRLGADLKFGTLSVREVWHRTSKQKIFAKELVWRELAHALLFHHPSLLERPFRRAWNDFPWKREEHAWRAWIHGTTGYPVVDAASRQLLAEGFVPNRARMITASFFTKHLLQDFRRGEAHFLRHLTDGDWANNDLGWQWSTGCGCDAQPWFRVFNPVAQGERFDPRGEWVRRWIPELRDVPNEFVHAPWLAKMKLDYPKPIVDHAKARARFLRVAKSHLNP